MKARHSVYSGSRKVSLPSITCRNSSIVENTSSQSPSLAVGYPADPQQLRTVPQYAETSSSTAALPVLPELPPPECFDSAQPAATKTPRIGKRTSFDIHRIAPPPRKAHPL